MNCRPSSTLRVVNRGRFGALPLQPLTAARLALLQPRRRPAAVAASLAPGGSADVVLVCSSGDEVPVYSPLLRMTSPVLHDLLGASDTDKLQVEGSKEAWDLVLEHLYPTYPRPELTLDSAYLMLPLVQQYNVHALFAEIMAYLSLQQFNTDSESPAFISKWLKLADDLKLASLLKLCMRQLRSMAIDKDPRLEQVLVAGAPTESRTFKVQVRPATPEPIPYESGDFLFKRAWCDTCQAWTAIYSTRDTHFCGTCNQLYVTETTSKARWFPSDEPKLLDSIKSLSHDTLADMLASMVVVWSGDCSKDEPAAES